MKKPNFYTSLLLIAWLIAASCANIVTPAGGVKDVSPPVIKETFPLSNTENFPGNTIKISFDEFVKLTDISKQVIVSPFTENPPDIKTRGKSVVVVFNDTLRNNTTYSIAFGDAISDITENNILSNYRFVFSTGTVIDTLMIKGIVKNALTQKAESDVYVMLYTHNEDSVPLKETPYYLARTGADGSFYFSSLHNDNYKIFALKDLNNDYLFDQPSEKIAFLDTLIKPEVPDTIADSVSNKNAAIHLNLFEEEPAKQRLMKAYPAMYGKVNLVFNKPLGAFSLNEVIKKSSGFKKEINKTKDTLTLWMNNPDDDSLVLEVCDNNVIIDTAEVALIKKGVKTNVRSGGIILALRTKHNVISKSAYDYYKPLAIEFSNPIVSYDFSKMILTENNDTIKFSVDFDRSNVCLADTILRKLAIDYKWKEGTNYSLLVLPAAFRDIFNLPNDTLKIDFKTTELKDYGNVLFKVKTEENYAQLIAQLVNEKEAVIGERRLQNDSTVKFDFIKPGNYNIKIIVDLNNNGKWDTGNYLGKKQPEKVYYNPSSIQVKANWDMEYEWALEK